MSTVFASEEGTGRVDRTMIAFGIAAFAKSLAVPFQQQVSACASVERLRDLRFDCLLRLSVGHAVILALLSAIYADKHMRAIRGDSRNRRNAPEEQYAVYTRIGNIWKSFQRLANLGQRSSEARTQIAAVLILNPSSDFHKAHCSEF